MQVETLCVVCGIVGTMVGAWMVWCECVWGGWDIWKVLLLGIFSSWFVLTELCLYIH